MSPRLLRKFQVRGQRNIKPHVVYCAGAAYKRTHPNGGLANSEWTQSTICALVFALASSISA